MSLIKNSIDFEIEMSREFDEDYIDPSYFYRGSFNDLPKKVLRPSKHTKSLRTSLNKSKNVYKEKSSK